MGRAAGDQTMKILIAVDGSAYTKRMLAFIVTHGEWLGPQHFYTVLHCVAAIPHRAAAFADKAHVQALYQDDAEAVLQPIRVFFDRHGLAARFLHCIGPAGPAIADHAERQQDDLIILGTHGHGAAAGLVLGSVAMKVVALCRTPVLLIR
jgi:nucleotide-binding universal stress UspA family protein